MMRFLRQLRAAGAAVAATLSCAAAMACPTAVPQGLKGESIGEDMVVNGLPIAIRQVAGPGKAEDVLARVERTWADEGHIVRRGKSGEWSVVSAHSEKCNTTLQLEDRNGRVVGYLGVGDPAKSVAWLPKRLGFTMPSGVQLNSTVSGTDSGRQGHTISFSTRRQVSDINDYFLNHLGSSGWGALTSHELRMGNDARARLVKAQKGREQISLVLWDDGQTRAVMNIWESL